MSLEVNDDLLNPTTSDFVVNAETIEWLDNITESNSTPKPIPPISLDVEPGPITWMNILNDAINAAENINGFLLACCNVVPSTELGTYPNPFTGAFADYTIKYKKVINAYMCRDALNHTIRAFLKHVSTAGFVTAKILRTAYDSGIIVIKELETEYEWTQTNFRTGAYCTQWRELERKFRKPAVHDFPHWDVLTKRARDILFPFKTPVFGVQTNAIAEPEKSEPTPTVTPTNEIITTITEYIKTNQDTIVKVAEAAKLIHALLNPKPKIPFLRTLETKSAF